MSELRELVAGAVLLVALVFCTTLVLVRRRRYADAMRAALSDPEAATRLAAIETLAREGPEGFVPSLLWRNRVETDPAARDALTRVIGDQDDELLAAGSGCRERRRAASRHIRSRQRQHI